MAIDILWHDIEGPKVSTDQELSEKLADCLRASGIQVTRVGRKPKSRSKWVLFTLEVWRVKGLEMSFLTPEEANAWQEAKSRSVSTLMKAPDEAFREPELEITEITLYWTQALKLAYRMGCNLESVLPQVLSHRGRVGAEKVGLL